MTVPMRPDRQQKTGDDDKNLNACAAQANRPAGLRASRNHERVARTGAQRAFHIHPSAQREQFQPDQQHREAGEQRMHLRDPTQPEQAVDEHRTQDDIDDCAEAKLSRIARPHRLANAPTIMEAVP